MADGFTVEVKGLKEIDEKLVLLGAVAGEKVIRSVMFFAVQPFRDAAVQNIAAIQTGSGALAKSTRRVFLRATTGSSGSGTRFTFAVAPRAKDRTAIALANLHYKRRRSIRGIFWGHLVEWGFTTRSGRRIPGRLVFTRAFESTAEQAIEIFRVRMGTAVERALNKQNPVQ